MTSGYFLYIQICLGCVCLVVSANQKETAMTDHFLKNLTIFIHLSLFQAFFGWQLLWSSGSSQTISDQ